MKGNVNAEFPQNLAAVDFKVISVWKQRGKHYRNTRETEHKNNSSISQSRIYREDETIESKSNKIFKILNSPNKTSKVKTLLWWTEAPKIEKKRTNSLRKREKQRITNANKTFTSI